tara:strand:- start:85427 stop:86698 length:1272 start_codon:yes stop_codon:yes gene_type:complete
LREIILFSLPSIAASLLEPLSSVVDTALVGQLDTKMLAALAVGTTLLTSFTWVFNFLVHASTSAVASSDQSEVGGSTRVSLTIALFVGLITAFLLYLFRLPLYELMSSPDLSPGEIDEYFIPRLIGHPFAILFMTSMSLLRGLSRVNLALTFVLITTGLNIFLSWLFLYPMSIGLSGAAWGTVLANGLGMIFCFIALFLEPRIRESFKKLPPREHWFKFGKNSLNLFGRSVFLTGSLFLGAKLAAAEGEVALASHQILLQVWLFVSFFIDGVAITANIKGSSFSGMKQQQKFSLLTKRVLGLGALLGLSFSIFYFLFESFTQQLFTNDPEVLNLISTIWPWIVLSQIPNALAFVYDGLLFGLGPVGGFVFVRRWMMVGALFVFLPIALSVDGLMGVWIGLISLNVFRLFSGFWSVRHLQQRIA